MNQMTTTTIPGSIRSLLAESGLSKSDVIKSNLLLVISFDQGKPKVTGDGKPEEVIQEIYRDLGDPRDFENHDLLLAASQVTAQNHLVDIPFPIRGVRRRGTSIILKRSLAFVVEEVAKIMICAGKKVDNQTGMGIIAVALADLATTETATVVSWLDKAKPVLYALLCAFQVSVVVLRPGKNRTPCSAATSSPAPVKANAEKLGDLIAGGLLLSAYFVAVWLAFP